MARVVAPTARPAGVLPSGFGIGRTRAVLLGAALLAAILIGASVLAGRSSTPVAPEGLVGVESTRALLDGIPQQGITLGSPDAPVRLVEYADLQCPYCADFANATLPTLIEKYVRTGRLSLEFRGLAFIGADSQRLLRLAHAASAQASLWQVVELAYRNQGAENSGWATEGMLELLAGGVAGSRADALLAAQQAPWITKRIAQDAALAERVGVTGTPYILLGRKGDPLHPVQIAPTDLATFEAAIQQELGS
jgi:protein-disulfide isomerase